ncbi:MAG: hypothetical protein A3H41_01225 [Omnitrophica WOR_2 bacterium RIFCSPLOWO2_02_FULL_45_28]|nr:MAG: hypothetical protein A3H41_01225 [Omnitrophica WOR_2 bacterium RIFCSPLOWO2_02_FULL_45_28]
MGFKRKKSLTKESFSAIKMEKNEVYDYLAKVYLDKQPSLTARPIEKKQPSSFRKYALFLILPIIALPLLYLFLRHPLRQHTPKGRSLQLDLGNELIKIRYDFTASDLKKEGYAIALADLNARGFKELEFKARRCKDFGVMHLRVALENNFRENAARYVNVDSKWRRYKIKLSDFKEITAWDNLKEISFIIEEWNVADKDDCLYIDELSFTK